MPILWTITPGSAVPIYQQIVHAVGRAISAGQVLPDEQLPSVRALAEQLVVNPNTVARAYAELARGGLIETRQGRGVFVAADRRPVLADAERQRQLNDAVGRAVDQALVLGCSPDEIRAAVQTHLAAASRPADTSSQTEPAP